MSGNVAAAEGTTTTTTATGVDRYVDALYELLAGGVEPQSGVTLRRVEVVLHEHARSPKSVDELKAFFEEGGLSLTAPEVAEGSLRLLDPIPAVEPPPAALNAEALETFAEAGEDVTLPSVALPAAAVPPVAPPPPAAPELPAVADLAIAEGSKRRAPTWLPAGLAAIAFGLGAAGVVGYVVVSGLQDDLSRAQQEAASNRAAIERLGEQTSEIRRDVGETGETMRRFERKNDVLLDALLPAPLDP